ncbi:MAG: type II secretion system protein [Halothece sp. Uz-M2-17]|nr:type II secretion system protein [Halothece sp. Uz-M2-17]
MSLLKKEDISGNGFTLLEVLIGIVIITTFTLTALQALVLSTFFKVQAEQESGATNWIQERIEEAKFIASRDLSGDSDPETADSSLCTASNASSGYGAALESALASVGSTTYTINSTDFLVVDDADSAGKDIAGQNIWLLRHTNPKDEEPYNVLELQYVAVLENSNGNPSTNTDDIVAELYTEVIPDEAFYCN